MIVEPKTIVKPLGPMIGGAVEKPLLPFHCLANGYPPSKTTRKPSTTMVL